uniref:Uncharacterized protein n=1 Tax=Romanomermis culicivorax TaxID=13658 RepID=A0A915JW89_ROMCU
MVEKEKTKTSWPRSPIECTQIIDWSPDQQTALEIVDVVTEIHCPGRTATPRTHAANNVTTGRVPFDICNARTLDKVFYPKGNLLAPSVNARTSEDTVTSEREH